MSAEADLAFPQFTLFSLSSFSLRLPLTATRSTAELPRIIIPRGQVQRTNCCVAHCDTPSPYLSTAQSVSRERLALPSSLLALSPWNINQGIIIKYVVNVQTWLINGKTKTP